MARLYFVYVFWRYGALEDVGMHGTIFRMPQSMFRTICIFTKIQTENFRPLVVYWKIYNNSQPTMPMPSTLDQNSYPPAGIRSNSFSLNKDEIAHQIAIVTGIKLQDISILYLFDIYVQIFEVCQSLIIILVKQSVSI